MASDSLYAHYLEYILSPPVLLTLWILLVPLILERYKNYVKPATLKPFRPSGCFRLGLRKASNLSDQYDDQTPSRRQSSIGGSFLTGTPRVKALFTYPIKSCRGVELAASEINSNGLKYDRLLTFAQLLPAKKDEGTDNQQWRFITQRECPKLALLQTELWVPDPRADKPSASTNGHAKEVKGARGRKKTRGPSPFDKADLDALKKRLEDDWAANGGCAIVHFPYEPGFNPFGLRTENVELRIPLIPTFQRAQAKSYGIKDLSIWRDCPRAIDMTNEIDPATLAKLRAFLGVKNPLGLFRVSDKDKRAITRSLPKDRPEGTYSVGFADAFPINILNLASVRDVDASLPKQASMKDKLDSRRFRANIYVTGPSAFAEDSWKRVTLGRCIVPRSQAARDRSPVRDPSNAMVETDGLYHVACRTARCTLPNTDPNTGVKDRNEPYSALKQTRVVDEGAKPHSVLGLHLIPLFAQGIVRVSDEIEVLERGENVYEKMFPG